ncbi:MAG: hypothetical protein ACYCSG_00650 [Thermoplasmataceae archaeon]
MDEKGTRGRVRTSLRKAAYFFGLAGNIEVSHETIRRNVPPVPEKKMDSSGYLTYGEQYVSIDGRDKFRALLKDTKNGNFVEAILDDLREQTLIMFFTSAIRRFMIHGKASITTDGYHYEHALKESGRILNILIRRQRCLFHIEKDLAHRIRLAGRGEELDSARKLIKFMFFQTFTNLRKIKDHESFAVKIKGKSEPEIVEYILDLLNDLYSYDPIIETFLEFVRKNGKEVFLYLKDADVEKTSKIAEQHFSIMSWLFKRRFKTKEGLLRTSYWYHHYLSTGM